MQTGGYTTKYHYLGGAPQWTYCRFLAQQSGLISSTSVDGDATGRHSTSPPTEPPQRTYSQDAHERYLRMLEAVYEDNMAHRVLYPGAPDTYRERVYSVNR